jgi:hypothetical protein
MDRSLGLHPFSVIALRIDASIGLTCQEGQGGLRGHAIHGKTKADLCCFVSVPA